MDIIKKAMILGGLYGLVGRLIILASHSLSLQFILSFPVFVTVLYATYVVDHLGLPMTRNVFTVLMGVIWAIMGGIIGLVLKRTSSKKK